MKKLLTALLLLLLGGGGAVGIDKLGSSYGNQFEKPTNTLTSASTVAVQRVAINYNRQFLYVINTGTSTAYMWLNTSTDGLAVGRGIQLAPMTTTTPNRLNSIYEINQNNLYFGPVQFIASDYTTLLIIEK